MTQGGPLIVSFTNNTSFPSPLAVDVTVNNAADIAALMIGETYVNVASNTYQGGECRGQLLKETATDAGADAATDGGDAGSSGSSGSSGTSGTSGASGTSGTSGGPDPGPGSSNGAITTPSEPPAEEKSEDGGGCSTAGSESSGGGLAMAALAVLGIAVAARARKKR